MKQLKEPIPECILGKVAVAVCCHIGVSLFSNSFAAFRVRNDLLYVERDVKLYSVTASLACTDAVLRMCETSGPELAHKANSAFHPDGVDK